MNFSRGAVVAMLPIRITFEARAFRIVNGVDAQRPVVLGTVLWRQPSAHS